MTRWLRPVLVSMIATLMFVAVALAATPVKNSVYTDSVHGVTVAVTGTTSIHAFDVTCHGKTWIAKRFITVKGSTFSYNGPSVLTKNGKATTTTGTMSASGRFKTSHSLTGRFSSGRCSGSYSAVYAGHIG
jgi:hypothetical protein